MSHRSVRHGHLSTTLCGCHRFCGLRTLVLRGMVKYNDKLRVPFAPSQDRMIGSGVPRLEQPNLGSVYKTVIFVTPDVQGGGQGL